MLELMTSSLAVGCPTRRECDSYEHRYPQAVNGVSSLIQQISFSSGTSMCTADGSNTVTITFHSVLDPVSNADDFDLELLLVDKSTLLLRGSNESECSECTAFDGYMNTALTKRNLFQIDETSQGCSDEAMCVDALTGLPQNIVSQVKNGVAHFRGLNIDRAAKRYVLVFLISFSLIYSFTHFLTHAPTQVHTSLHCRGLRSKNRMGRDRNTRTRRDTTV